MTRSTETTIKDLEAQLAVQRAATLVYQNQVKACFDNLRMMGREDIVKSIQRESITETRATLAQAAKPQPKPELEDDDCLY